MVCKEKTSNSYLLEVEQNKNNLLHRSVSLYDIIPKISPLFTPI